MKFEIMKVTPEQAGKWFMKNEGNRKLRESRAAYLAAAILNGKWQLTHQAIAISKRGKVLDGQHRLRAVILAGKAVEMVVATDVPESTFAVMDAGLPRAMHERIKSDKKDTAVVTNMYRLLVGRRVPHEYEVELLLDVFNDAFRRLAQVPKPVKSKIEKAPAQAAFALRMALALKDKDDDRVVRLQWMLGILRRGDLAGAPPIISAYYRQLVDGVANLELGVGPDTDGFARTWMALDPQREGASRLQVNDHSGIIKEAKEDFADITDRIFDQ